MFTKETQKQAKAFIINWALHYNAGVQDKRYIIDVTETTGYIYLTASCFTGMTTFAVIGMCGCFDANFWIDATQDNRAKITIG